MKWFAYKFWPGMEIQVNRDYVSYVVSIVSEVQPSGEELNLIIYKDWNPYKKIWDYHIDREISLSFTMKLYKEELNSDLKYYKEDKAALKRMKESALENFDGTKPTLDFEHMKNVFSKYEINKECK